MKHPTYVADQRLPLMERCWCIPFGACSPLLETLSPDPADAYSGPPHYLIGGFADACYFSKFWIDLDCHRHGDAESTGQANEHHEKGTMTLAWTTKTFAVFSHTL